MSFYRTQMALMALLVAVGLWCLLGDAPHVVVVGWGPVTLVLVGVSQWLENRRRDKNTP